jgi:hypothetical protein
MIFSFFSPGRVVRSFYYRAPEIYYYSFFFSYIFLCCRSAGLYVESPSFPCWWRRQSTLLYSSPAAAFPRDWSTYISQSYTTTTLRSSLCHSEPLRQMTISRRLIPGRSISAFLNKCPLGFFSYIQRLYYLVWEKVFLSCGQLLRDGQLDLHTRLPLLPRKKRIY